MGSSPRCPCVSGLCSASRQASSSAICFATNACKRRQSAFLLFCASASRRSSSCAIATRYEIFIFTSTTLVQPARIWICPALGGSGSRGHGCVRCVVPPSMLTANRYGGGKESEGLCLRAFASQKRDSSVDKRGGYASLSSLRSRPLADRAERGSPSPTLGRIPRQQSHSFREGQEQRSKPKKNWCSDGSPSSG